MEFGITGDAALVTAGTDGLGLASAEALAKRGANVAVCGRDEDRLERAEERLSAVADGGDVLTVRADITDGDDIGALVEATAETFGGLDHLVTNAGGPPVRAFAETDERDWYEAHELLVMSVVRTMAAAQPHLEADGGGTVVSITSRSDKEVIDGHVLSNAARRPVVGLMKTLSRELAPAVRANAVLPGPHETDRVEGVVESAVEAGEFDDYDAGLSALTDDVPMDRIGRPSELGETVAWLSSDLASYVNGVALPVDGGGLRSI